MRYPLNTGIDPAFNLAAEQYLLQNASDDCFMLWRNHNTIVVGKNQHTFRSRVTNIRKYLLDHPTVEQFMADLGRYIQKAHHAVLTPLSDNDLKQISEIAREKYRQWRWNFGDSPTYDFSRSSTII